MPRIVLLLSLCLIISAPSFANLLEAEQALAKGKTDRAHQLVKQHLRQFPNNQDARFLLGQILTAQNKVERAIETYAALSQDFPNLPEPYNNLAVLFVEQGEHEKALQALTRAIRTHPSYATAHANLGDLYTALAAEAYDRALQLKSDDQVRFKLTTISDLHASTPASLDTDQQPAQTKPAAEPAQPTAEAPMDFSARAKAWAAAWSAQNVEQYLDFYHPDFQANGVAFAAWSQTRHARLLKPAFIKVGLANIKTEPQGQRVIVRFQQQYQADHYQDLVNKTLTFALHQGQWKIIQETSDQ